jgi:sec-independent protein translocase protein TatA
MSPLICSILNGLGFVEIMLILGAGVLIFGKRLPDVGRSLGKGIVEFKKGLRGLEDEVETASQPRSEPAALEAPRPPQRVAATAPKFEEAPAVPPTPPKFN